MDIFFLFLDDFTLFFMGFWFFLVTHSKKEKLRPANLFRIQILTSKRSGGQLDPLICDVTFFGPKEVIFWQHSGNAKSETSWEHPKTVSWPDNPVWALPAVGQLWPNTSKVSLHGVPKKRTVWIAFLQSRVWGYGAFHCKVSSQLWKATYPQTQFRKMLFQKVRFLGYPVSNINSNQRIDLMRYIAQNFLYRIAHQTAINLSLMWSQRRKGSCIFTIGV